MSSADFRSLSQYNEPLIRSPSIYSSIGSGIYLPQGTPLHGGVFVLANTILGAGMLGLPFAFAACGYLMGTLMLTGFGACATGALVMLSEAADHVGRPLWKNPLAHDSCSLSLPPLSASIGSLNGVSSFHPTNALE